MRTSPVVAATDGSEEALAAVEWAAREAMLRGAPLRIVSAPEMLPGMAECPDVADIDTVTGVLCQNRDFALATAVQRAAAAVPGLVIGTGKLSGPIAQAVTRSGSGAAMLVVGSRGLGAFAAMVLGSVSRYAATCADCPVVVVREQPTTAYRQIVAGIRDANTCADALAFAFGEAAMREAGLTVVHARHTSRMPIRGAGARSEPAGEAPAWLPTLLAGWQDKYPGVKVTQKVANGHPGRVLADLSAHADLTVIGRRDPDETGRRGPATVTHALLHHARGPIVTVPSPMPAPRTEP